MKSVLDEAKQIHYVDDCDIINFIVENSTMSWNTCCDFVREQGITARYGTKVLWNKDFELKTYNKEQVFWIGEFFKAHPWINQMMICFDS